MPLPSTCKDSADKSPDSFMGGGPLFISCLSIAAFKILSLSLTFYNLIIMCLGVGFL